MGSPNQKKHKRLEQQNKSHSKEACVALQVCCVTSMKTLKEATAFAKKKKLSNIMVIKLKKFRQQLDQLIVKLESQSERS